MLDNNPDRFYEEEGVDREKQSARRGHNQLLGAQNLRAEPLPDQGEAQE
jgi:hypothetical protein